MKQGEIWQIDLNPVLGSEQAGIRPCLVVSGNVMNEYFDLIMVCPMTSKIKGFHGNLILVANNQNGLTQNSEVLTFHIRTISKKRALKKLGIIPIEQMNKVLAYIQERFHL